MGDSRKIAESMTENLMHWPPLHQQNPPTLLLRSITTENELKLQRMKKYKK